MQGGEMGVVLWRSGGLEGSLCHAVDIMQWNIEVDT